MKSSKIALLGAAIIVLILPGCETVTAVTDGIGGVFHGLSDDMRSMRR
ncbi:MAG: hypothetical protein JJT95_18635 [Pararhodobacter sp.]|nr:hypothetical protein [Pararhodobacter sp.]